MSCIPGNGGVNDSTHGLWLGGYGEQRLAPSDTLEHGRIKRPGIWEICTMRADAGSSLRGPQI